MSVFNMRRAAAAAMTATMLLGAASSAAYAEVGDYEFLNDDLGEDVRPAGLGVADGEIVIMPARSSSVT
jgi:hypothetical protein